MKRVIEMRVRPDERALSEHFGLLLYDQTTAIFLNKANEKINDATVALRAIVEFQDKAIRA